MKTAVPIITENKLEGHICQCNSHGVEDSDNCCHNHEGHKHEGHSHEGHSHEGHTCNHDTHEGHNHNDGHVCNC